MNRFKWCGILLLLSVLVWGGGATGATINVPGDYATIQAAIDAAVSGDVIVVAAGTYTEDNVLINKGLTVQGAGVGSSVIDASASVARTRPPRCHRFGRRLP